VDIRIFLQCSVARATTVVLLLSQQMKSLFCERLAARLHMKQSPSSSVERSPTTKILSVNLANSSSDHSDQIDRFIPVATESDSLKELLKGIHDLLKSRVHSEEEQRCEDDKENEMKKDWMLAAAVLDRICAIAFTVVFIGGTLIFFVVFAVHP